MIRHDLHNYICENMQNDGVRKFFRKCLKRFIELVLKNLKNWEKHCWFQAYTVVQYNNMKHPVRIYNIHPEPLAPCLRN